MECRTCKRTDAHLVKTVLEKDEFYDSCNFCGYGGGSTIADVYYPGPHSCQNITDDKGVPIQFTSKGHKAQVMREKGLTEAGDRIRGSYALPKPSGRSWYEQRRSQGKLR